MILNSRYANSQFPVRGGGMPWHYPVVSVTSCVLTAAVAGSARTALTEFQLVRWGPGRLWSIAPISLPDSLCISVSVSISVSVFVWFSLCLADKGGFVRVSVLPGGQRETDGESGPGFPSTQQQGRDQH